MNSDEYLKYALRESVRLQGNAWFSAKHGGGLALLAVYKSKAGHYMALLQDERVVEKRRRSRFVEYHMYIRHWLCDFEADALLKSGWIERNGLSDFPSDHARQKAQGLRNMKEDKAMKGKYLRFKAQQDYVCDLTRKKIVAGQDYYRVYIRRLGVLRFHKSCSKQDIDEFIDDVRFHRDLEDTLDSYYRSLGDEASALEF